jgi:aryl-alcohol dehydrogenase-like predicted oxidoreductase
MKYNTLGSLSVSELCLGSMTWGEQNSEAEAHAQLDYAVAHGVNFIDTAEMYPVPPRAETGTRTESYVGTWLKRQQRDRLVVGSKIAGPGRRDWLRGGKTALVAENIIEACNDSLRRLQTDYLDLYQIHWPARNVQSFGATGYDPKKEKKADKAPEPILGQIEGMAALIKAGKIRNYGLSNESAWGICQFCAIADQHGLPRPLSVQNVYSLVSRQFDLDLAEVSYREKVPLLAYSPLAGGKLSGKYLADPAPSGARFTLFKDFQPRNQRAAVDPAVAGYAAVAKSHGLALDQMAIAFVRQRWFAATTIIGATSLAQLERNIAAADVTLDEAVLADIEAVHARHSIPAP